MATSIATLARLLRRRLFPSAADHPIVIANAASGWNQIRHSSSRAPRRRFARDLRENPEMSDTLRRRDQHRGIPSSAAGRKFDLRLFESGESEPRRQRWKKEVVMRERKVAVERKHPSGLWWMMTPARFTATQEEERSMKAFVDGLRPPSRR